MKTLIIFLVLAGIASCCPRYNMSLTCHPDQILHTTTYDYQTYMWIHAVCKDKVEEVEEEE